MTKLTEVTMKLIEVKTQVSGSCRTIGAYSIGYPSSTTRNLFHWCTALINRYQHLAKSLAFTFLTLFPEQRDSRFSNIIFQSDRDLGIVLRFSWRWQVSLKGYFKICLLSEQLKRRFVHWNLLQRILLAYRASWPAPLFRCCLSYTVSRRPVMSCSSVFNLIIEHVLRTAPPYLYRFEVVAVLISFHRKRPKRFMTSGSKELPFRRIFSVAYRI